MPLTNAGRDHMVADLIGETVVEFNAANAHIGVGDGGGAFAATQTNLQGLATLRRPLDAGFPTRAGNVITFRSTFGTAEANFAWNEWGVFNAAAGGTMLNRLPEVLGTKTATQTWQFTATLTVQAGV